MEAKFGDLVGKTLIRVAMTRENEDDPRENQIVFFCDDGSVYRQYHEQDCCEKVAIEDVCGDLHDIIGSPIVSAEEMSSSNHLERRRRNRDGSGSNGTWTFYKIDTALGGVSIRWLGQSNGYYSETVEFSAVSLSFYDAFMSADDRNEDAWQIGEHDCGLCVAHDVAGNAAMVVNLPPRNESAKQYAKLEQLHRIFRKPDFMVLGYRESGYTHAYEKAKMQMNFVASFPVSRHGFCTRARPYRCQEFSWLCAPWNQFPGPVSGAFEMFLIDRNGRVAARFAPGTSAMDSRVLEAVSAIVGPCNS